MSAPHDFLTLCVEELIVRAARRYVLRRKQLPDLQDRAGHERLIGEHRRNIETLVALRASLLNERAAGALPTRSPAASAAAAFAPAGAAA